MVHYKLSVVYCFVRVAYGPLQTLASVGLAQACPNKMKYWRGYYLSKCMEKHFGEINIGDLDEML